MKLRYATRVFALVVGLYGIHHAGFAAGLFDIPGALLGVDRRIQEERKVISEAASRAAVPVTPPPPAPPASAATSARDKAATNAANETRERQTIEQQQAVAEDIAEQIMDLRVQLARRLAISPRTPELLKEIKTINDSLTAKRSAYDFAKGMQKSVDAAGAEAFANTSNPYFLICRNVLWAPRDKTRWIDMFSPRTDKLIAIGRSVGLISIDDQPRGSAFVVGPNHVITNLHVLKLLADYDSTKKIWILRDGAKITFDVEYSLGKEANCENGLEPRSYYLNGVVAVPDNSDDDMAILLTSSDHNFPPSLQISRRESRQYEGNMTIAVIGYPGPPVDMTTIEAIEFFRTPTASTPQYPFKRISGGYTRQKPVTNSGYFEHLANTSQGNSGSPVIDLSDGALVGIHVSGYDRSHNLGQTSSRIRELLVKAGLSGQ